MKLWAQQYGRIFFSIFFPTHPGYQLFSAPPSVRVQTHEPSNTILWESSCETSKMQSWQANRSNQLSHDHNYMPTSRHQRSCNRFVQSKDSWHGIWVSSRPHWHQLATKSKSLNSWCSLSPMWRRSRGGVRTAFSTVNSSSKLLTSSGWRWKQQIHAFLGHTRDDILIGSAIFGVSSRFAEYRFAESHFAECCVSFSFHHFHF